MVSVPAAPDVRPSWQRLLAAPWRGFRALPWWLQLAGWLVGFWILPAAWLAARATGPVGFGSAGVAAVIGVAFAAAAVGGEPVEPPRAEVAATAPTASPSAADTRTSAAPSPGPSSGPTPPSPQPSPSPSPTPEATTTPPETPTAPAVPAGTPTAVPTPTPTVSSTPTPRATQREGEVTTVERIVDGDTLYLVGLPERARLIGIDTPETVKPGSPVECFGPEASAALERLVPPGTEVRVVFDVERVDQYDRPLVYLHRVRDDLFVNRAMVRRGFAQVATYPPNVAHVDEFTRAQRRARTDGAGLWSASCDGDESTEAAPPAPGPTAAEDDAGGTGGGVGGSGSGGGEVVIADLVYDTPGDDVEFDTSEHVVLRNDGGGAVDVGGWSLTDLVDHRITIPDGYRIPAGGELSVHTGPGDDTDSAYHDGAGQAIWNNSGGDTATLRDSSGAVVAEFSYSS